MPRGQACLVTSGTGFVPSDRYSLTNVVVSKEKDTGTEPEKEKEKGDMKKAPEQRQFSTPDSTPQSTPAPTSEGDNPSSPSPNDDGEDDGEDDDDDDELHDVGEDAEKLEKEIKGDVDLQNVVDGKRIRKANPKYASVSVSALILSSHFIRHSEQR